MKRLIFVTCCFAYLGISAQNNNLQNELDKMVSGMQQDMDIFNKQIKQDFNTFVEQQDKAFSDMLEQNWSDFKVFSGQVRDGNIKPIVPPRAKPEDKRPSSSVKLGGEVQKGPAETPKPNPRISKTPQENFETISCSFSYYGATLTYPVDKKIAVPYKGGLQEKEIAGFWRIKSSTEYDYILNHLYGAKEKFGLNDWGFYQLVTKLSERMYANDTRSARLLTWFLMNKAGYRARIGISGEQVIILLPFVQTVYELPFVEKSGIRYYAMNPVQGNLRTYNGEFSEGNNRLDMNLPTALNIPGAKVGQRPLKFSFKGKSHEFKIRYNQAVIDFYNDYPITDLSVYFDASVSAEVKEDIYLNFMPLLEDCSTAEEKVQLLLDFIYEALPYMTDDDQFGRERYFFVEECFAYPYTDCEDRSVLFSYMVHSLLNYPTIGLLFPGHVSAAVCIDGFTKQAYTYQYQGRDYISCDPTYINSLVGMAMSGYMNQKAELIPVKNNDIRLERQESVWEILMAKGLYPGSPHNNMVSTSSGKNYLCGYFNQPLNVGNRVYQPISGDRPSAFVACADRSGNFDWFVPVESVSDITQIGLVAVDRRLYLTGNGGPDIRLAGNEVSETAESIVFLANVNSTGDVQWLSSFTPAVDENIRAYKYTLDNQGQLVEALEFPETGEMEPISIFSPDGNHIVLAGIVPDNNLLTVAGARVTHSTEELAVPDLLNRINNDLISSKVDPSMAGIFAFVDLLNKPGQKINGQDVVVALDKYNPTFKQRCPNIYKNIAAISIVVNESGVITVQTSNGKPVNFDKVRIQSGSKVRMRTLPSKDIKLEVIDGVKVGAAIIWFKLNHIVLYRENGDLLFDYDKNHTTKTFNLGKDILN